MLFCKRCKMLHWRRSVVRLDCSRGVLGKELRKLACTWAQRLADQQHEEGKPLPSSVMLCLLSQARSCNLCKDRWNLDLVELPSKTSAMVTHLCTMSPLDSLPITSRRARRSIQEPSINWNSSPRSSVRREVAHRSSRCTGSRPSSRGVLQGKF